MLRKVKLSPILIHDNYKAQVDNAKAALDKARLDMNRYKALIDQNAVAAANL